MYKHALEHLEATRSELLPTIDLFEGLEFGRGTFSALAPVLGPSKKLAMSPSSTVHGGQHDNQACDNRVVIACRIRVRRKFEVTCFDQLVPAYLPPHPLVLLARNNITPYRHTPHCDRTFSTWFLRTTATDVMMVLLNSRRTRTGMKVAWAVGGGPTRG